MANLSFLAIGIPSSGRLVFRNIHDQETVETVTGTGGANFRTKKKKATVIRYSDFTRQEEYAAALAQAAIPLSRVHDDGSTEDEDDDEAILQALFLVMTIH